MARALACAKRRWRLHDVASHDPPPGSTILVKLAMDSRNKTDLRPIRPTLPEKPHERGPTRSSMSLRPTGPKLRSLGRNRVGPTPSQVGPPPVSVDSVPKLRRGSTVLDRSRAMIGPNQQWIWPKRPRNRAKPASGGVLVKRIQPVAYKKRKRTNNILGRVQLAAALRAGINFGSEAKWQCRCNCAEPER